MNNSITIHADSEKSCFVLTGNIVDVLKNRRFIFSLKRLNFFKEDKKILIPYEEKTQIRILKELQEFLVKFNFSEQFTEETKKDVASFHREQKTFKEFSEQARKIRDNEINKDSKLFKNLIEFEEVLKKRLSRQLYKNKEDDNPYDYFRFKTRNIVVGVGDIIVFSILGAHSFYFFPLPIFLTSIGLLFIGISLLFYISLKKEQTVPGLFIPSILSLAPWIIWILLPV